MILNNTPITIVIYGDDVKYGDYVKYAIMSYMILLYSYTYICKNAALKPRISLGVNPRPDLR